MAPHPHLWPKHQSPKEVDASGSHSPVPDHTIYKLDDTVRAPQDQRLCIEVVRLNKPTILLIGAIITSIIEMLLYINLGYDHPIPALGFIIAAMAIFAYAHDKSRPTED